MTEYIDRMPTMHEYAEGKRMKHKQTDLISRADAIEAVAQQWLFEASAESPYVNDDDIGKYRKIAEELFEDVPSADAEQGEWIWNDADGNYYCGNCHYNAYGNTLEIISENWNFCPSCGARMKGGDSE